jgi:hypothetical protein
MFQVPRVVGFGCHVGCAVLFCPWRIAFRPDAILCSFCQGWLSKTFSVVFLGGWFQWDVFGSSLEEREWSSIWHYDQAEAAQAQLVRHVHTVALLPYS